MFLGIPGRPIALRFHHPVSREVMYEKGPDMMLEGVSKPPVTQKEFVILIQLVSSFRCLPVLALILLKPGGNFFLHEHYYS